MIDVGEADSILIKYPYNQGNILVDTGRNNYTMTNGIIPYLKSAGVRKIHHLIISHGDLDHIGGALSLINNYNVENIILNKGDYSELEIELINNFNDINITDDIDKIKLGNRYMYFLNNKVYNNENDNSNVIYFEYLKYKFLFMGDSSITTEKEILNKYNLFDIDVLKVGHHGSKTSSSKEFISEINPKYSIISVGKNNRYGHPNKEVLNNLDNSKIYRTDKDGSIMFKIKNNKLKVETCSP